MYSAIERLLRLRVADVMSKPVVTVSSYETMRHAARVLMKQSISPHAYRLFWDTRRLDRFAKSVEMSVSGTRVTEPGSPGYIRLVGTVSFAGVTAKIFVRSLKRQVAIATVGTRSICAQMRISCIRFQLLFLTHKPHHCYARGPLVTDPWG